MQALEDLKAQAPKTLTDLRQLIGLIGFYQDWIANYELRIGRWQQHIKHLKGTKPTEGEIALDTTWNDEDQTLLIELLDELITRPTLARPDYTRRFYLKTDWCRLGMAAVLLQADPDNQKAEQSENQEANKEGQCEFDKHMHRLRLRPIAFSSRKCTDSEGNMHSFTGEAATGVWAIEKYKRHLFGKEFTWMTDCNGLRQFFDGEDVPTHIHQRMRQRLLRFMFTIVHRPARFMIECDVLTRYNNITAQWRPTPGTKQPPIAIANQPIELTNGKPTHPRTLLAAISDATRIIWAFNAGATNIESAADQAGIKAEFTKIEERPGWRTKPFDREHDDPKLTTIDGLEAELEEDETTDWIVAHDGNSDRDNATETDIQHQQLTRLIELGERHQARAVIIFTSPTTNVEPRIEHLESRGWTTLQAKVQANRYGATVATRYTLIVATRCVHTLRTFHMERQDATAIAEILDTEREPINPNIAKDTEIAAMQRQDTHQTGSDRNEPKVAAIIQRKGQATKEVAWITAWTPCYDTEHPGPDLQSDANQWYESPFAIETTDRNQTSTVRGIRQHELIDIVGFDDDSRYRMHQQPPELAIPQVRNTPPRQLVTAALQGMYQAELSNQLPRLTTRMNQEQDNNTEEAGDHELRNALTCMLAHEFQQTTAIPLPTTAQWQDATTNDADLNTIAEAIRNNQELQRHQIHDPTLFKLWRHNELEEENGIIYQIGKGNANKRRNVRTKVAPAGLRQAIFSALHASPMAGHTGFQKTYWKVAARYYWPNMATDIRTLTLGCGHCNAANIASHEAQQQLQTFESDAPFDVITLDVWHPGKAAAVKKGNGTHVVTCIDAMTGFAAVTFVDALDSETMTRATFTAFFISHGLPKLVIIDSGSEFAGAVLTICTNIGIPTYTVSKGQPQGHHMRAIPQIHEQGAKDTRSGLRNIPRLHVWNHLRRIRVELRTSRRNEHRTIVRGHRTGVPVPD